ncbi:MAG: maleylpyruvate isomerase family mycothiol-dependent enzyme [Actinomycetota bacterium]
MSADLLDLATDERRELAALLEDLAPHEWEHPSLCRGWKVRDVVAHLISYEDLGVRALVKVVIGSGMRPAAMNARTLAPLRLLPIEELLALVRERTVPRGLTALGGGMIALTDGMIHQQDIRRPLNRPRDIPAARLRPVLHRIRRVPLLPSAKLMRGLRFVATDLDWATGDGPEVHGPGETLMLAAAGRDIPLGGISGDGAAMLRHRLARSLAD